MEKKIAEHLQTTWAAGNIVYKDTTVSTNEDAKTLATQGAAHGTLVVADTQSGGKGRRGRIWQSSKGTTVSMTLLCRPDFAADKASMLTLVMGLAVAEAIKEQTGLPVQIKWPNDIVVNGKKVCGILTELGFTKGGIDYLIIGVGINVNNGLDVIQKAQMACTTAKETERLKKIREDVFGSELADIATSLYLEAGQEFSREKLIAVCMEKFEFYYEKFLCDLDLHDMMETYNSILTGICGEVRVLDPKGEYIGISQGIDAQGNLLVEADGVVQKVYAGEVSVRGLYGYV